MDEILDMNETVGFVIPSKNRAEFSHYASLAPVFIISGDFSSRADKEEPAEDSRDTVIGISKTFPTFSKDSGIHVSSSYNSLTCTIMNKLNENHFSFKCPMNWDDMTPSSNGRFCGKCSKEVHDLTNCSLDEIRELQRRKGSICGMIRILSTATVAATSLGLAACKKEDSNKVIVVGEVPASAPENVMMLGDIGPIPKSPTENDPTIRGLIAPVPPRSDIQEKDE